ncbi:protease inhibitor I42 family protein [Brevibacillus brevis]|uniref:protease inhibitor I42 family protein n=1 Tax=Brevibacillus brevis TaxID=1393 RepID=UPI0021BD21EB|nr:protease inhibitor I42 family protein [Brevibacillus brevis]
MIDVSSNATIFKRTESHEIKFFTACFVVSSYQAFFIWYVKWVRLHPKGGRPVVKTTTYTLQVQEGHLFTITLVANPTTGYQWDLSNPVDARFLSLHANHFVPPPSPARIGKEGIAGSLCFMLLRLYRVMCKKYLLLLIW